MVEENPEVKASIAEGGDFKKPSEKKNVLQGKKNSEDKKVEEVEATPVEEKQNGAENLPNGAENMA